MRWYFEPHRDPDRAWNDGDSAEGLSDLPAELLQRHGATVLDPATAALTKLGPPPRSTVYRTKTLLIPGDLLDSPASLRALNAVLAQIGLKLVPVGAEHAKGRGRPAASASRELAAKLAQLPRTAVLAPVENSKTPVMVDAWLALQTLRAAATAGRRPKLSMESVSLITLEHLLTGSSLEGPASDGDSISGSPASHGHGITGPGSTDSYLFGGLDARTPVAVCLDAPPRESAADCNTRFGRRPVIMTLDTGVRAHPWLNVQANPAPADGYLTDPDGFRLPQSPDEGRHPPDSEQAATGDRPRQVIRVPDGLFSGEPLLRRAWPRMPACRCSLLESCGR
jgi:hypothetical protein